MDAPPSRGPRRGLGGHALDRPGIPAPHRRPRRQRPGRPRRLAPGTDHRGSARAQRAGREPGAVRPAGAGARGARSLVAGGPARPAEPEVRRPGTRAGSRPPSWSRHRPPATRHRDPDAPTAQEAVVTRRSAWAHTDPTLTSRIIRLSYGTRLPVARAADGVVEVVAARRPTAVDLGEARRGGRSRGSDAQAHRLGGGHRGAQVPRPALPVGRDLGVRIRLLRAHAPRVRPARGHDPSRRDAPVRRRAGR